MSNGIDGLALTPIGGEGSGRTSDLSFKGSFGSLRDLSIFDEEDSRKSNALTRSVIFDPVKRKRYKWNNCWIALLLSFQITIAALPILAVINTIHKDRKTMETQALLADTLECLHMCIIVVMTFCDPLRPGGPWLELLSYGIFIVAINAELVRNYYCASLDYNKADPIEEVNRREEAESKQETTLWRLVIQDVLVVIIMKLSLQKRARLKQMRKKGVRLLITHSLPLSFFSMILTVLYITAESIGCITRRKDFDIECWDVVDSNYAFSIVFVTFFFLSVFQVPFRDKKSGSKSQLGMEDDPEFSLTNLMRFKLRFKEQFGLMVFSVAGLIGLFLFASSYEFEEVHELDEKSSAYYQFKEEREDQRDPEAIENRKYVRSLKSALSNTAVWTCTLVILSSFFKNSVKDRVRRFLPIHLHTESEMEFAPAYILILVTAAAFSLIFLPICELYYVRVDNSFYAHKFRRYMDYVLPVGFLCVFMIFFSAPRETTRFNTFIYFLIPVSIMLKAFAEALLTNDFPETINKLTMALIIALFYKVARRSRSFLALQSDEVVKTHMQSIFRKLFAVAGPMVFLCAESTGCVLGINEPDEDEYNEGLHSKEGCGNTRRLGETFCEWVKWKIATNSTSGPGGIAPLKQLQSWGIAPRRAEGEAWQETKDSVWCYCFNNKNCKGDENLYMLDGALPAILPLFPNSPTGLNSTMIDKWSQPWSSLSDDHGYLGWNESTANWALEESNDCSLETCDGIGLPNNIVTTHLTLGVLYWIFFGFTFDNLSWDDIASLKVEQLQCHIFVQIIAITLATVVAFFVFGFRSEDSIATDRVLPILQLFVISCWIAAFLAQAMHLRREHMSAESTADDVLEKVFGRKRISTVAPGQSAGFGLGGSSVSVPMSKTHKDGAVQTFIKGQETNNKRGKRESRWGGAVKYAHHKAKIDKVLRIDAAIREVDVEVEQVYENPFAVPENMKSKLESKKDKDTKRNSGRRSGRRSGRASASKVNYKSKQEKKRAARKVEKLRKLGQSTSDYVVKSMALLDDTIKWLGERYLSSNFEKELRLAPFYRFLAAVVYLVPYSFLVAGAVDKYRNPDEPLSHNLYYYIYDLSKFMGLHVAGLLIFMSLEDDTVFDIFVMVAFAVGQTFDFVVSEAWGGGVWNDKQGKTGWFGHLGYVLGVCAIHYVAIKCKGSMKKWMDDDQKLGIIVDQVFVVGILGAIVPLIYVTSESIACAVRVYMRESIHQGGYDVECGNLVYGVKAMNVQTIGVFVYSISVGPLMAKQMGGVQLSAMVRLDFGQVELFQLVILLLTSIIALYLFGMRSDDPLELGEDNLFIYYCTFFTLWVCMFLFEAFYRRWDRIEAGDVHEPRQSSMSSNKREVKALGHKNTKKSDNFSDVRILEDGEEDHDDLDEEVGGVDNIDFSPGLV